ncbi:MAG: hypothetical protein KAI70_05710, partial [Candidatus Omnitrophica bacterium]|nr:hypothetical protein [Candidatus Omnitrophota bacterium]
MENNDKILHENLKKQIYKQLDKVGIAHELVDIKFTKDSELVLSGELYSEQVHQTIVQIVMDITGEENIIDRLIVIAGLYDDQNDDDNDGFYN